MKKTRKRILRQVAAGKISAEQGEKLLKELERDERSHDTSLSNFGSNVIFHLFQVPLVLITRPRARL